MRRRRPNGRKWKVSLEYRIDRNDFRTLTFIATDDEDQTRSGTPTSAGPDRHMSEEEPPSDAQMKHRELMSTMFPQSADSVSRVAEQFFPRHEEGSEEAEKGSMKVEPEGENREDEGSAGVESTHQEPQSESREQGTTKETAEQKDSHSEDVEMQEAGEAQAQAGRPQSGIEPLEGTPAQPSDEGAGNAVAEQASVAT